MQPHERSTDIASIDGLEGKSVEKFKQIGIHTIRDLLERGATRKDRQELSEKTAFSESQILDWVRQAELLTIEGIGPVYLQLLRRTGVKSAPALSLQNSAALYKNLQKTNLKSQVVQRLPSRKEVRNWVKQAGKIKAGIR